MRKLVCFLLIAFSAPLFAAVDINKAITQHLKTSPSDHQQTTETMIYGGSDVATADESVWKGEQELLS